MPFPKHSSEAPAERFGKGIRALLPHWGQLAHLRPICVRVALHYFGGGDVTWPA